MPVDPSPEKALFLAALEKATPDDQAAFLDEACGGDTRLRQRVEALLQAHAESGDLLDRPAELGETDATIADSPDRAASRPDEALTFLAPGREPDSLGRLGHYEVLEVVGRGGMGVVMRARDSKLERVVAVKALAPQLAAFGTARKRFLREARAAAAIRDEHVIDIYAVEEDGPVPYLVMQFIDGTSLQERIDRAGALPVPEVLRIGMQAAAGLAAAHKQGLVHRDIKPANILLENGIQRVKITDFGLARAVDDASLTQSGVIAGTPMFMSPEQARGDAVDHRTDLFSLGSVLYTLCTGRPPFRAGNTPAVLKRVCEDTPRPIREVNPEVPGWLAEIVARLLAKDAAKRYQSAAEVAEVLRHHLARVQMGGSLTVPAPEPSKGAKRRSSRRLALWAAALLVVAAVIAGVVMRRGLPKAGTAGPSSPKSDDQGQAKAPERGLTTLGGQPFSVPGEGLPGWMAVDSEGRLALPVDRSVLLIDTRTGRLLRTLGEHAGRIYNVAFRPDGQRLAAGNWSEAPTVKVWDTTTGDVLLDLAGHTGNINSLAYSPDGTLLASASTDGTAKLWNAEKGTEVHTLKGHTGAVYAVAFDRDGRRVATAGEDRSVRLWDAATGQQLKVLEGHSQAVGRVAFSPDGTKLLSGSEEEWKLWDADKLTEVCTVTTRAGWVAFLPNGNSLFAAAHNNSGSPDEPHRVSRWDLEGNDLGTLSLKGQGGWATYALSPDGKTLFEVTTHVPDRMLRAYDSVSGKELTAARPGGAEP